MNDKQCKYSEYGKKYSNGKPMPGIGQKRELHGFCHKIKRAFTKNDTAYKEHVHPHKQAENKTGSTLGKIKPCRYSALFFVRFNNITIQFS